MTTEQILESFTPSQRDELKKNLRELEVMVAEGNHIPSDKLGEINVNLRLDNDKLLLNMTVMFICGSNERLVGQITELIKFNNIDEYLDAINISNRLEDDWKSLK